MSNVVATFGESPSSLFWVNSTIVQKEFVLLKKSLENELSLEEEGGSRQIHFLFAETKECAWMERV